MTNVFILPGTFGHPYENWFSWLHKSLSEINIPSYVLSLPSPEGQDFETWSYILKGYHESGLLGSHSIVVAHSAGCAFFARYVFMQRLKVRGFISVAGYNNFISGNNIMDQLNKSMYFDKSIASPNLLGDTYCFLSPNDPYIPLDVLESFADIIDGDVVSMTHGGHFNTEAGFTEFEALLKIINSIITPDKQ